ncbi:MAG: hypothetical protein O3C40_28070 [Planctomycetota bacterium]|nr:hypothetical protein [Planctomycetota bacterium]
MHYTPNGREAKDITQVGVWFADPNQVTHEVTTRVALNHHFDIAHPRDKPRVVARSASKKNSLDPAERQRRIDEQVAKFLKQMDRNHDGVVERDETPEAFRRYRFREIEAEAGRRL